MRIILKGGYQTTDIPFGSVREPAIEDDEKQYSINLGERSLRLLNTLVKNSTDLRIDLDRWGNYCKFLSRFSVDSRVAIVKAIDGLLSQEGETSTRLEVSEGKVDLLKVVGEVREVIFTVLFR